MPQRSMPTRSFWGPGLVMRWALGEDCPRCSERLRVSCDMWGSFWVCGECGFTAEDDDEVRVDYRRRGLAVGSYS